MIPGFGRSEVVIKFTQIIYDPKIPMDTNPKRTGVALVSISNPAGILESGLKRQKTSAVHPETSQWQASTRGSCSEKPDKSTGHRT